MEPSPPQPQHLRELFIHLCITSRGCSHSFQGPWPLFFCKRLCPLLRCCYWWRSSSGTRCVWSCSLCTADSETLPQERILYNQILAQESHIIPQCCIPDLDFSSLALLKLVEFQPLKYFFYSSFLDSILKFPKLIAVSFSQIPLILLCVHILKS